MAILYGDETSTIGGDKGIPGGLEAHAGGQNLLADIAGIYRPLAS